MSDGQRMVVVGTDGAQLPRYGWILNIKPTDSARWVKPEQEATDDDH